MILRPGLKQVCFQTQEHRSLTGYLIVKKSIDNHIDVECFGPTALIPALVVGGLPSERFTFEDLPIKRKKKLFGRIVSKRTMIFYESPKLIKPTDFLKTFGPERQVSSQNI